MKPGERFQEHLEESGRSRFARWRYAHVMLCAQVEDESRERHKNAGDAECPGIARESGRFYVPKPTGDQVGVGSQSGLLRGNPGNNQKRKKGTEVDGEIKSAKCLAHQMALI